MSLFFATCSDLPELTPDDRLAAGVLGERGVIVHPLVWDGPDQPAPGDVVVLRSTWDYHLRATEFRGWLEGLVTRGVRLENAAGLVFPNLDKVYLLDLAARGVPVVPTRLVRAGETLDPTTLAGELDAGELVVKPRVSANAWETRRVPKDAARQSVVDRDLLVQPYLREIETDGEWSLAFFDGTFSHALVKRPKSGDFRVQEDHGGTNEPAVPTGALLAAARSALETQPIVPLYARVDLVVTGDGPLLVELELVEPSLYLALGALAPERFAEAILARL